MEALPLKKKLPEATNRMSVGERTLFLSRVRYSRSPELSKDGLGGGGKLECALVRQSGGQAARYFVSLHLVMHPGPWTDLFKYVNSQAPPQSYGPIPKGGVEMSFFKVEIP